MKIRVAALIALTVSVTVLSLSACAPVDKNYGVQSSEPVQVQKTAKKAPGNVRRPAIMSDDKVMPKFVDISLFDEENYSSVYLGKKFRFNVTYSGSELNAPTTLAAMEKNGWKLAENEKYNEESLIYACDSVDAVFTNESGASLKAVFYNSSNSSVKMKKCSIVKLRVDNNFYQNTEAYNEFNVNGVNNRMAITDIIDTLGTPSHFYGISENNYYLDYFISRDDRRNGITVYIDPTNDSITAIEFSYYK